jgi:hypothetical protein
VESGGHCPVVEQVRGRRTSAANRLVLQKRRPKDPGERSTLRAWRGKSQPKTIAILFDSEDDLKDPLVKDALDRLLGSAGVIQE